MLELTIDEDVDTLIWSSIQGSTNACDYLNYINHASGRTAEFEAAFVLAEQYWKASDAFEPEPGLFANAFAQIQNQAENGCTVAMLHLGQFHCFGIGTAKDMKLGQSWLKRGADLGNRDCAIFLGQSIGKTDGAAARVIFEQAISEGHLFAHTELAELDPTRARYHWEQALLSEHPYTYTKYGEYLINQSATDEEKFTHVDWIRKGADGGDIYAHILLSTWYTVGANGCTKDEEVAKYWAQKGAAMGSPACYWTLGRMGFYAKDKDGNAEFEKLLRRASMLKDEWSQSLLGWHFVWKGKTFEAQQEGVQWLRCAARQGYKPAMYRLSEALRDGRGADVDEKEALYWLQLGADLGNSDCQCALGVCYLNGGIMEKDFDKAHQWFQIASLQGEGWPWYLLGISYEDGLGVTKDYEAAVRCFKEGAELGDPRSIFKVGMAYYYGNGLPESNPAAVTWFKRAAELGNSDAQSQLGIMLAYGHGVDRNSKLARKWFEAAAAEQNRVGLRELARFYECGTAVRQDIEEATRLMGKAAALGDPVAIKWVDENCPEKPAWLQAMLEGKGDDEQGATNS